MDSDLLDRNQVYQVEASWVKGFWAQNSYYNEAKYKTIAEMNISKIPAVAIFQLLRAANMLEVPNTAINKHAEKKWELAG